MTEEQILAIKCAHADLVGAYQNYRNGTYSEHSWKDHLLSIEDLEREFDFLPEFEKEDSHDS